MRGYERPLSLLLAAWVLAATAAPASDPVPVIVGGDADLDACGSVGEVYGLDPAGDGFLSVRAGPGTGYKELDRLHNADRVILCADHGKWLGVVYGEPGQDCGVGTPIPKRKPYDGPCHSGWINGNWVQLVAG